MPASPFLMLLLIACAGAGIGAFLYTLAVKVAWEIRLHELRVQTHRLRIEQNKKIAMLRSAEMGAPDPDVDVRVVGAVGDLSTTEVPGEHRKAA